MNSWPWILFASLLALPGLATFVWWGLALAFMRRTEEALGSAEDGLDLPPPSRRVLVVIPAHNEQAVIATLISSLRGQDYPHFRVVLALDRCTDATLSIALETIAGDDRFQIVEVAQCPPDWTGKVHAIHSGVKAQALGENQLLLFADADTRFAPECVRSCVALLEHRKLAALTLLSTLTFDRAFERRVQGPASMELLVRYPPRKASRSTRRRPFANGQFILMTETAYRAIGTHEAFKDELLEDLAIARALWREKLPVQVLRAGRMLVCRMYPDRPAFDRGWTRIFIEAAKRKPSRLRAWSLGTTVRGFVHPLGCLLAILSASAALYWGAPSLPAAYFAVISISLLGLVVWISALNRFLLLGGVSWWRRWVCIAWWPFGSLALAGLLRRAAANLRQGVPTGWAGKNYARPAR